MSEDARHGRGTPAAVLGVVAALLAVTAGLALGDPRPDAPLRHAYLVPVIVAALGGGVAGGLGCAAAATLLDAPFVLPYVEREGLTGGAVEGLVTLAGLVLAGGVTGLLAGRARRAGGRSETLVRIQHAAAQASALPEALGAVRSAIAGDPATDVALVVLSAEARVTAGVPAAPPAVVDAVLGDGRPRFVPDVGGGPRPRRALLVPVTAADRVLGVLVVAREGEIGGAERETLGALGAYVGLALENARLAARQRRFAEVLSERVEAATRHRDALDRAKSTLVAVASHELRTPLTALRGFSELLALRAFAPDDVRRFAGVMQEESERLVRLIDDLLDLTRLEQGLAPVLRRAALDPAAVAAAVARLFARPTPRHPLEVDCPTGLPRVHADPDALDRILKNLVSNAMKYSPPGPVTLRVRAGAGAVEFVVEDHGPGIPADALPRLFEPWFRVAATAGTAPGTGLGLAVVRALVEAHGGTVGVDTAPGAGTRIRVTLPEATE